ncbi:hypothetical protein CK218_12775 [Mesorhizobium sp. WSM3879]|uniref:DUF4007 family protein n=1 Tax=Mesorhizobium sp. WSM3879 TaxID=2029406 RepID=UPI000BAF60DF|nr:DUF4007 family protein [Mesorhizobium sp. WSM3879]PBB81235.1 hypothetical protein CK218_12775 [Mesorhizobium sp. WSM3879]
MSRSLLDSSDSRLQFAGHETFPLRYGWLKKAYDAVRTSLSNDSQICSVFTDDSAIAHFGVGRNMVLSIRHWAIATDVLSAEDRPGERAARITTGKLGDLLFGDSLDSYLEHPGSLWLLHWMLAGKPGRATTWHWAFNEFHEPTFDRELMRRRLSRRCEELVDAGRLGKGRSISGITIRRDVDCLLRTYFALTGGARRVPEDSIESPLAELGLVQKAGVGELFRFRRGPKSSLPDEVFLLALVDFWRTYYPLRRSFSVDFLTFERGSPGQVFLLDEEAVAERLIRLDALTDGALRWDESSGMRQLYAHNLDDIDEWVVLRAMFRRDLRSAAA